MAKTLALAAVASLLVMLGLVAVSTSTAAQPDAPISANYMVIAPTDGQDLDLQTSAKPILQPVDIRSRQALGANLLAADLRLEQPALLVSQSASDKLSNIEKLDISPIEQKWQLAQRALGAGEVEVWQMRLEYSQVEALGLIFNKIKLHPGSRLFVYDPEHSEHGFAYVFGDREREQILPQAVQLPLSNNALTTGLLSTEQLVIEVHVPTKIEQSSATIAKAVQVASVLLYQQKQSTNSSSSGQCLGFAGYCAQDSLANDAFSRSVARMVTASGSCSGSLISNPHQDGASFFVTAAHCLRERAGQYLNAQFYWREHNYDCTADFAEASIITAGAYVVAIDRNLDIALLYLAEDPLDYWRPYYLGIDTRPAAFSAKQLSALGHPFGAAQHLAKGEVRLDHGLENNVGGDFSCLNKEVNQCPWSVLDVTHGKVAPGVSGAGWSAQEVGKDDRYLYATTTAVVACQPTDVGTNNYARAIVSEFAAFYHANPIIRRALLQGKRFIKNCVPPRAPRQSLLAVCVNPNINIDSWRPAVVDSDGLQLTLQLAQSIDQVYVEARNGDYSVQEVLEVNDREVLWDFNQYVTHLGADDWEIRVSGEVVANQVEYPVSLSSRLRLPNYSVLLARPLEYKLGTVSMQPLISNQVDLSAYRYYFSEAKNHHNSSQHFAYPDNLTIQLPNEKKQYIQWIYRQIVASSDDRVQIGRIVD